MNKQRPAVLSIAIILLILASLLFWLIVFLPGESNDPFELVVLYGSVVLGVLGLAAAFGIFSLKRWGMWLAIGVSVFSAFFGVGGIASPSSPLTKGLCIVLVALYVLIIVLVVLPSARQAYVEDPPSAVTGEKAN
jgi:peptidoglycan/LPS O-acetylase OafA/YrhL